MKGIVIWKGKYGATDQYAHSIGSTLDLPVVISENVQGKNLDGFDFIVLGSSVYIGKFNYSSGLKITCQPSNIKKYSSLLFVELHPTKKIKLPRL